MTSRGASGTLTPSGWSLYADVLATANLLLDLVASDAVALTREGSNVIGGTSRIAHRSCRGSRNRLGGASGEQLRCDFVGAEPLEVIGGEYPAKLTRDQVGVTGGKLEHHFGAGVSEYRVPGLFRKLAQMLVREHHAEA